MKYYAIKHKPTGLFMPQMRGGFSYWEPKGKQLPPRLFATHRDAANALTCWVNGRYSRLLATESEGPWGPTYEVVNGTVPEPDITRKRDDLQIVLLILS